MFTPGRLVFLLFVVLAGCALAADDDTLWMEAKPINGRMVFVRVWPSDKIAWKKDFRQSDIIVYVGAKRGDFAVRCKDVTVSAKDERGHALKVEAVEDVDNKDTYQHQANEPDLGSYEVELGKGQRLASVQVTWKKRSQTYLIAEAKKNVPWDEARRWCGIVDDTLKPGETYLVTVQDEVPIDKVEIFYYLGGPFGGFQSQLRHSAIKDGFVIPAQGASLVAVKFAPPRDASHSLLIPTKGAKEMAAAVYCPGYQFARIDVPALAAAKHEMSLVQKRLPMIKLAGRIESYKPAPNTDPVVKIQLLSTSAFSVSPAIDGMVPQFEVATVPLSPDGTFSAEVPDFAHDPFVWREGRSNDALSFIVLDQKTKNPVLELSQSPSKEGMSELKIQPSYDGVLTFYGHHRGSTPDE
jgi:hypothetical protein